MYYNNDNALWRGDHFIMSNVINIQLNGETGRIDKVLSLHLSELSRSTIQKMITNNQVLINDIPIKANYKVKGNEIIQVIEQNESVNNDESIFITPQNIPLEIIYEDNDLIVINKQKDLVVHPSKGHYDGTLVNALVYHLGNHLSNNDVTSIRPGIVHRIDKDTTGLLVIAKNNTAHDYLSKQLENHSMSREYYALIHGHFDAPNGTIRIPLGRNPKNRLKYTGVENGKEAITHFEVLKSYTNFSLIKCHLETGRTHQIRAHLEYIGHPIVGDTLYNIGSVNYENEIGEISDGQLLHAKSLTFTHPRTHEAISFESELPSTFKKILNSLE